MLWRSQGPSEVWDMPGHHPNKGLRPLLKVPFATRGSVPGVKQGSVSCTCCTVFLGLMSFRCRPCTWRVWIMCGMMPSHQFCRCFNRVISAAYSRRTYWYQIGRCYAETACGCTSLINMKVIKLVQIDTVHSVSCIVFMYHSLYVKRFCCAISLLV